MKVLFIGEGRHDIGDPNPGFFQPRSAHGMIPTLVRQSYPEIAPESVAMAWQEIPRFDPKGRKKGYPAKIAAAALLADQRFDCTGIVVVADRDGMAQRGEELEQGTVKARELNPNQAIVWGLAHESVEAWTLGVPENIAEELGLDVHLVRDQYPPSIDVEALSERSGKPEHRPKRILEQIAKLNHRQDSTEFRQNVAARTDVALLAQACPRGFAPFVERVKAVFGRHKGLQGES